MSNDDADKDTTSADDQHDDDDDDDDDDDVYTDKRRKEEEVSGPCIEISGDRLSQNYIICPPKKTKSSSPSASASASYRPSLGITLPYLYLTINVPKAANDFLHFSFEVTIVDDKQTTRRFRASTYQSTTVIKPDICTMSLKLERAQRYLKRDALLLVPPLAKKQKIEQPTSNNNDMEDTIGYYGPSGSNDEEGIDDSSDDNDAVVSCWNRLCLPLAEYTKRAYGTNYLETKSVQIHANCQVKQVYFAKKEMDEDDELPEEFRLYYCPSS